MQATSQASFKRDVGSCYAPRAQSAECISAGCEFTTETRIYSSNSRFRLGFSMVNRTASDTCRPKTLPAL
jgi:hypothetical protein